MCLMIHLSAAAQLKPKEADSADDRWVERIVAFFNDEASHEGILDKDRLIQRTLRTFQLTPQQISRFDQLDIDQIMLVNMRAMLQSQNGYFTFLRYREIDKQRTALFRFSSDAGLNYVEWFLETTADGEALASDYNSFSTGELASEALRRMWTPLVADMDPQLKKHMGKNNRELAEHYDKVTGIRQAFLKGDYEGAQRLYDELPRSLQENKLTMLLVMNGRFQSGDEQGYLDMLERFAKAYPDASNLEIMYIDLYFLREQYDKALEATNALDRRVGGDAYLELYRANIAYMQDDYEKAKRLIDRGLAFDSSIEDLYWVGLEHALSEKDWPRVSALLTGVERTGVELLDLTQVEGYEGYVASEAYQRWLAAREQAGPGE